MSDLLLARFLLAGAGGGASDDGRPDPGTVAEALVALGRSLDRFVQEDDLNNALSVLHTGALALTFADRPAVGAQLLHAVRRHAVRHGVRPESTDPLGAAGLERWLAGALDPSSRAAAEQAADGLDWAGMVALLDPAGGTAATRGR
jgi:hypothetical protein